MKYLIFTFSLFIGVVFYAQDEEKNDNTIEIKFEDGTIKKFNFIYDDPDALPTWQVDVFPFHPLIMDDDIVMSYQINPTYRLNPNMWVNMAAIIPYARGADPEIPVSEKENKIFKPFFDINPQFHYRVAKFTSVKSKKVNIDYAATGEGTTIYKVEMPRKRTRSLEVDGGINFQRRAASLYLERMDTNLRDTGYVAATTKCISLTAGISLRNSQSMKFKTDDSPYSYWSNGRMYGYITYALTGPFDAYMWVIPDGGDYSDKVYTPTSTGFVNPVLNRIGFRIGAEKTMGMKNKAGGMTFGFEFGRFPNFVSDETAFYQMPSGYFIGKIGFTIGGMMY